CGTEAHPIDYANASPDVSLVSLHYYFPWAIRTLVRWSAFCCASARAAGINQRTRPYFEVGDSELPYAEKLERYRELADAYFQLDEYETFCPDVQPAGKRFGKEASQRRRAAFRFAWRRSGSGSRMRSASLRYTASVRSCVRMLDCRNASPSVPPSGSSDAPAAARCSTSSCE